MDSFLDRYPTPKLNQDQIDQLNSPITPEEIKKEIKDFLEFYENEGAHESMGHYERSAKRKTHSPEYLQKENGESIYTSTLMTHLKALEQKETISPRRSRRQEIIKLRAEINQVETKRNIQRINKTRSWFSDKMNKIDKPLARLTKGHRDSIQINKIRNEKGDITTEMKEIQKIIRSYYKSLYATQLENLEEMDNFLDRYQILKLNQDQIDQLNSPITPKEIKGVIESLPTKKTWDQVVLVQNSIRPSKKT